ncbi:CD1375 family protein [Paenibacillus sp. HWE-109]
MVQLYYNLIKEGYRTINQVPEKHRIDVQTLLDADQAQVGD